MTKKKKFELKIAKDYSINFMGNPIPKNAIYGKCGRIAFYVVDFEEYRKTINYRTIYTLDIENGDKFQKGIYSNSQLFTMIKSFIIENQMWDKKCENVLCLNRGGGQPQIKKAQNEMIFKVRNVGYVLSKYTITDHDAIRENTYYK